MGWFDKYCEKCGVKVDKGTAPQRFGKYFCKDEHANEFAEEVKAMRRKESKQQSSGGCC